MASPAMLFSLLKRDAEEPDDDEPVNPGQSEIMSSWALFIQVALLILALFCSYYLQLKKIQAVHETVISIFGGMFVGLIIRVAPGEYLQNLVSFDYKIFFNVLLPPIILNSGYELHQANFFRNIGSILTFAFAGTFISAWTLGIILFLWSCVPLEGLNISFVEAIAVGATLSATDPVTILAIFNAYKVDPKLYTIIFGESILNDAVAIVMFETAQQYHGRASIASLIEGIGTFFLVFSVSLVIGVLVGIATALLLKHTYIRRFPRIESCFILLVAYASYLFSNGCHMSGIVSLLFCGITLKHYAYYNMSRRTQLTTKYLFQVLAQLSENFIFIYLGLSLFTDTTLYFRPIFILVTVIGICVARWTAVFPLSSLINWIIRTRATRRGRPSTSDEIPHSYQAMLFWAGLRGAVGVALAASLEDENGNSLRATVLVVVVLTVIVFGGTTARMLEILGIKTGVVEEIDSDDEFDIESAGGLFKTSRGGLGSVPLDPVAFASGQQPHPTLPPERPASTANARRVAAATSTSRNISASSSTSATSSSTSTSAAAVADPQTALLHDDDSDAESDASDLPPSAPRRNTTGQMGMGLGGVSSAWGEGASTSATAAAAAAAPGADAGRTGSAVAGMGALGAVGQLAGIFRGTADDQAEWFRKIDEGYIKPTLLLDPKGGNGGHGAGGAGGGGQGA